jgi:hypothetical protein
MSPLRIVGVRVFTLLLAVPHAIMAQASGGPQPPTRAAIVGGIGFTIMHLPAFTYTRGSAREPAVEPAQEGVARRWPSDSRCCVADSSRAGATSSWWSP